MPTTGSATAAIARIRTAASTMSPPARLLLNMAYCFCALSHAVPRSRGRDSTMRTRLKSSSGTVMSTQAVTTARAHGLSDLRLGILPAPRQEAQQGGFDPLEEVGNPGGVGEDVVAVEADQRQQLPDHLQHLGHDDEQQRVEAGGPPDAHDGDGDDRVEVEAAEVGPDAAGAAQPVGIGDVGEERGPDQVQAGAHGPRGCSAAAGRRRMPELVEPGGQHGHHQDQQHQARIGEGLVRGRRQALDHQHPPAAGEEGRGDERPRSAG